MDVHHYRKDVLCWLLSGIFFGLFTATHAALSRGPVTHPGLLSLSSANSADLLSLLTASGSTLSNSGTGQNVFVRIYGLENLTPAQQQAAANILFAKLNGGAGSTTASLLGANLPAGLNLGQFLGTSGSAALAAQSFANPFTAINPFSPSASLFGLSGGGGVLGLGGNLGGLGLAGLLRPNAGAAFTPVNPTFGNSEVASQINLLLGSQLTNAGSGNIGGLSNSLVFVPQTAGLQGFTPVFQR